MSKRHGGPKTLERPQERLTANPDEIAARTPLQAAALQMLAGEPAEDGPRPSRWWWPVCPPIKPTPINTEDFTGVKWGRLSVLGLLDRSDGPKSDRGSWVVRCDCGRFECRKAKAIRTKFNPHEACDRCQYVQFLRRRTVFDKTGRWPAEHLDVFA